MPIIRRLDKAALALIALAAAPAQALQLSLPPAAQLLSETVSDPGSYAVPLGPWREDTGIPVTRAEGRISRQAWRIDNAGLTTLQILSPLRDQLEQAGYTLLFDCNARRCGGFDFRFGTEVIAAPEMHVDLSSYRFLSARAPEGDYLTLLVSRSAAAGHVQIIRSGASSPGVIATKGSVKAPPAGELVAELLEQGHVILPDLRFETGAAALGEGDFASLEALAGYLRGDAARQVLLVGHTDAVGSLQSNTELSRARAGAAVSRLIDLGVPAGQVRAAGVGFLAPVASNLSAEGQEANRRVEAVLIAREPG